jgi:hypothetical protein
MSVNLKLANLSIHQTSKVVCSKHINDVQGGPKNVCHFFEKSYLGPPKEIFVDKLIVRTY